MSIATLADRVRVTSDIAYNLIPEAKEKYGHENLIGVGIISLANQYSRELKLDSFDSEKFRIVFYHNYK